MQLSVQNLVQYVDYQLPILARQNHSHSFHMCLFVTHYLKIVDLRTCRTINFDTQYSDKNILQYFENFQPHTSFGQGKFLIQKYILFFHELTLVGEYKYVAKNCQIIVIVLSENLNIGNQECQSDEGPRLGLLSPKHSLFGTPATSRCEPLV